MHNAQTEEELHVVGLLVGGTYVLVGHLAVHLLEVCTEALEE